MKLTFVMWSGTSQRGHAANNMFRMKNGLQQRTNVKKTRPNTYMDGARSDVMGWGRIGKIEIEMSYLYLFVATSDALWFTNQFTLVAFCSVATAFADKFVRLRWFKKPSLKFNEGVGTLLKFIFKDRNLWRRVSRSIFSGVWVLLSCVCPPREEDENRLLRAFIPPPPPPPLILLLLLMLKFSKGWDVLVLMLFDLRRELFWFWSFYMCSQFFFRPNKISILNWTTNQPLWFQNSTATMCSPVHRALRLGMWKMFVVHAANVVLARRPLVFTGRWLLLLWRVSSTAKSEYCNERKM